MNPFTCSLALSLTLGLGGGAPAEKQPFETIIQDDAQILHRPRSQLRRSIMRMKSLGIDRVRITAGWRGLAPDPDQRRRPDFDATDSREYPRHGWRLLDRAVREVTDAGMEVMIDVAFFAPRWASRRRSPKGWHRWRPSVKEFGLFTSAVVRRYNGDFRPSRHSDPLPAVRLWTTWNEPNYQVFLLPQWRRKRGKWYPVSPHHYRRMHEVSYAEIKRVSRANKVLIGGLASVRRTRPSPIRGIPPLRFTRELACVDSKFRPLRRRECRRFKPLRADGFALHPYSLNAPPGETDTRYPDSTRIADVGRMITLLKRLHGRGRLAQEMPVYLTEYGYETNPPDPTGVPLSAQAVYLAQATYLAWRHPEVKMYPQFLLRDIPADTRFPPRSRKRWADFQTGLYHPDGRAKPAVSAFKLPFWAEAARTPDGGSSVVFFGQVRPDEGAEQVTIERKVSDRVWTPVFTLPLLGAARTSCAHFSTDRYGVFTRRLRYEGPREYRATWHRRDRARPLHSAAVRIGAPRPTGPRGVLELVRPPD